MAVYASPHRETMAYFADAHNDRRIKLFTLTALFGGIGVADCLGLPAKYANGGIGDDGAATVVWDAGNLHLEFEIEVDADWLPVQAVWFFRDRDIERLGYTETEVLNPSLVPEWLPEVVERFKTQTSLTQG